MSNVERMNVSACAFQSDFHKMEAANHKTTHYIVHSSYASTLIQRYNRRVDQLKFFRMVILGHNIASMK